MVLCDIYDQSNHFFSAVCYAAYLSRGGGMQQEFLFSELAPNHNVCPSETNSFAQCIAFLFFAAFPTGTDHCHADKTSNLLIHTRSHLTMPCKIKIRMSDRPEIVTLNHFEVFISLEL